MRFTKIVPILFAAFSIAGSAARAADIYWTNTLDGNWSTATNWNPNQVPGTDDNAFITQDGTYMVTVDVGATVGSLTVGATSGTQTVSVVTSATLTLKGSSLFGTNSMLNLAGGWLSGPGYNPVEITLNGPLIWAGGWLYNGLVLNANGGIAISGSADKNCEYRVTINNAGAATWTGGELWACYEVVFNNLATGVFEAQSDASFRSDSLYPPMVFNNAGTFRKTGGTGITAVGPEFNNTGTVEVQSGTLSFIGLDYPYPFTTGRFQQTAGSTLLMGGSISSSGTIEIAGGLLGGSGQVNGTVRCSGQLSPGLSSGIVQVVGDYIQTDSGSYNVQIGGTVAGTNFDQLTVTGNAQLLGYVNVLLTNGFVPNPGDSFEIVKAASQNTCLVFSGLNITNGLRFEPIITATNIVLLATTAPPSASPRLQIAQSGNVVAVCWLPGHEDFSLQSTTNLVPANWLPVALPETNRYLFQPDSPMEFFRMISP